MKPLKLGLLADTQYCDCENAWNYEHSFERFYRNSLNHLDSSLKYFTKNKCNYVLQLGDLIDGKCKSLQQTEKVLGIMKDRFESLEDIEVFHVVGNHEMYNLSREKFMESFLADGLKKYQKNSIDVNYFKVPLRVPGTNDQEKAVSLIVLDTYEVSILSRRGEITNDLDYLEARRILQQHNHNDTWNSPESLKWCRYVAFNGAVGSRQLAWLRQQLEESQQQNEIVIVIGHIPLLAYESNPLCQVWNYSEVVELLNQFSCVKVYLCGHTHMYEHISTGQKPPHSGSGAASNFIQITMPGIIEAQVHQRPYTVLSVHHDRLEMAALPGYCSAKKFPFL